MPDRDSGDSGEFQNHLVIVKAFVVGAAEVRPVKLVKPRTFVCPGSDDTELSPEATDVNVQPFIPCSNFE